MTAQVTGDPITVRRAVKSDATDISVLYLHFLRAYGHDSELKAVLLFLAGLLTEPWVKFFVATDMSDKIVGFAGCALTYSAVSQSVAITINDMFVDAAYRRHGVATSLCDAIEAYAKHNGYVKIFLETDSEAEAAIATYKKAGFVVKPYVAMVREVSNV